MDARHGKQGGIFHRSISSRKLYHGNRRARFGVSMSLLLIAVLYWGAGHNSVRAASLSSSANSNTANSNGGNSNASTPDNASWPGTRVRGAQNLPLLSPATTDDRWENSAASTSTLLTCP